MAALTRQDAAPAHVVDQSIRGTSTEGTWGARNHRGTRIVSETTADGKDDASYDLRAQRGGASRTCRTRRPRAARARIPRGHQVFLATTLFALNTPYVNLALRDQ